MWVKKSNSFDSKLLFKRYGNPFIMSFFFIGQLIKRNSIFSTKNIFSKDKKSPYKCYFNFNCIKNEKKYNIFLNFQKTRKSLYKFLFIFYWKNNKNKSNLLKFQKIRHLFINLFLYLIGEKIKRNPIFFEFSKNNEIPL